MVTRRTLRPWSSTLRHARGALSITHHHRHHITVRPVPVPPAAFPLRTLAGPLSCDSLLSFLKVLLRGCNFAASPCILTAPLQPCASAPSGDYSKATSLTGTARTAPGAHLDPLSSPLPNGTDSEKFSAVVPGSWPPLLPRSVLILASCVAHHAAIAEMQVPSHSGLVIRSCTLCRRFAPGSLPAVRASRAFSPFHRCCNCLTPQSG